eukprot:scaffold42995_cov100-Phaeocystis_antarctica.AAC.2
MKSYVNASQKRSFEEQLDQGIKQPRVEGMTPQAVRTKIHYEKYKHATRLQPPFPAAVQADGPIEISTLR